jgi:ABC-2 type transport system permease protein
MQQFSALFPLKWLTQAMRSVFLPPEMARLEVAGSFELAKCAAVLVAWTIAGLALSLMFFRWNKRGQE